MNRLLRYILIVNSVLILFAVLITVFGGLNENYQDNYYTKEQIDQLRESGEVVARQQGAYYYICYLSMLLFFFGMPLLVLFFSIKYNLKNLDWFGYFKSLLISVSYLVLGFIITGLLMLFYWQGEEGMTGLFVGAQLAVTLGIVMIINLLITAFGYSKKDKHH
ncbi:MAG: hypothetical protein Q8N63_06165 [Nanoarchaeota archaeon]|nr:hypothetical protein [Nanoarchaeota archaeon]